MTRLEFIADRLRHQSAHLRHEPECGPWGQVMPSEQRYWLLMAQTSTDADSAWHPIRRTDAAA